MTWLTAESTLLSREWLIAWMASCCCAVLGVGDEKVGWSWSWSWSLFARSASRFAVLTALCPPCVCWPDRVRGGFGRGVRGENVLCSILASQLILDRRRGSWGPVDGVEDEGCPEPFASAVASQLRACSTRVERVVSTGREMMDSGCLTVEGAPQAPAISTVEYVNDRKLRVCSQGNTDQRPYVLHLLKTFFRTTRPYISG